jgi:hypothetical protein
MYIHPSCLFPYSFYGGEAEEAIPRSMYSKALRTPPNQRPTPVAGYRNAPTTSTEVLFASVDVYIISFPPPNGHGPHQLTSIIRGAAAITLHCYQHRRSPTIFKNRSFLLYRVVMSFDPRMKMDLASQAGRHTDSLQARAILAIGFEKLEKNEEYIVLRILSVSRRIQA